MVSGRHSRTGTLYLIDSGVILRELRRDQRAAELLNYLARAGTIHVSVVTLTETLVGCRTPEEESAAFDLFRQVTSLPIDEEAAIEAAAPIRRYPGVFGREISRGTADAFIAGTAIRRQMKLVTLNIRHFASVPIARLDALVINQDSDSWLPEA